MSGLGGKPSEENASKNVFGMSNAVKPTDSSSAFGAAPAFGSPPGFGTSVFGGSPAFSSGSPPTYFSFGGQQQVSSNFSNCVCASSQTFGSLASHTATPGFGSPPSCFGSPPAFGTSFGGNSMASPVSHYYVGGKLTREPMSTRKMKVIWDIHPYSCICVKSEDFPFAGATFNFFASFYLNETRSQFGINARTQSSFDEAFDCDISFVYKRTPYENVKHIECKFIFQKSKSYWEVTDFLSSSELQKFLSGTSEIHCLISVKDIKDACSQTEDSHLPENEVCRDFKNLLLSGEGSDVTLQVQDQEFKAHQLVITARSSVFAAMFHHDMKEKATRVVNVEDCEPSYFPVLLEFLYCGSTEKLSVENVFSLYTSSDKYDIKGLKTKCIEFIKNNLSVETFCDTARLSLQHSEADLLKFTTDFFTRNLKKIILTVKWQTFLAENPVQSNEFLIKALVSDVKDD